MSDIVRNLRTEITTFEIVIGVVVSVILAQLWLRALDNLFYKALGFPKSSFYASLVIAIGLTIFFFVLVSGFNEIAQSVVLGTNDPISTASQALNVSTPEGVVNIAPRCVKEGCCNCERSGSESTRTLRDESKCFKRNRINVHRRE